MGRKKRTPRPSISQATMYDALSDNAPATTAINTIHDKSDNHINDTTPNLMKRASVSAPNLPISSSSASVSSSRSSSSSQRKKSRGNSREPTPPPEQPLLVDQEPGKKWRNAWTRTLWTLIMIAGFTGIILSGHLYVIIMVIAIQTLVFKEVIAIAHVPSKEKKLPWFRVTNWYFLLTTNYYLYGETLMSHFQKFVLIDAFLQPLASHHRFISFSLYMIGFVLFVMNLKKGHYKFQFLQFFWTHMTLLVVVIQSHFIISNILQGLIWFVMPASFVITNDVFAYVCGFFFGRTRLIALSPKKTWEGFLGAFFCTLFMAIILSRLLMQSSYMICPAQDLSTSFWSDFTCTPNPVFVAHPVKLPPFITSFIRHLTRMDLKSIMIAPLQFHAVVMACFASFIAPFGGFFASGFKRAFKLKDFGQSIPGHGGMTDRMDCQFMMGFFSYLYYTSFIKTAAVIGVDTILEMAIMRLSPSEQMELYRNLGDYLEGQNMLE